MSPVMKEHVREPKTLTITRSLDTERLMNMRCPGCDHVVTMFVHPDIRPGDETWIGVCVCCTTFLEAR